MAISWKNPKYEIEECQARDLTYAAPLSVKLRMIVFDVDKETETRSIKDIKEQDVYIGDLPLMTPNGTFVVNGAERVVVSQMHRSPGVFFDHDKGRTHSSGKLLYLARIIPYRGSWLDFEFDAKDILYVRIDRKRKIPATMLLYALGLSSIDILELFYDRVEMKSHQDGYAVRFNPERWVGVTPSFDIVDASSGKMVSKAGVRITAGLARKLVREGLEQYVIGVDNVIGQYVAEELIDEETGIIEVESGSEITEEILEKLIAAGISDFRVWDIDNLSRGPYIRDTLALDRCTCRDTALMDIYRVLRPGDSPTLSSAEALLHSLFFDEERYDLSVVGRVKMNMRLDLNTDDSVRILRKEDILAVMKMLVGLRDGEGEVDDIDNLANRRVRSVGELLENQFRLGLTRMERATKERMGSVDIETVMPNDVVNAKPVTAAIREFFSSSQLSQFMDQTNPLSEVTHKRRLSALGPGGLNRERAGFEVRDVHTTHYGRICPVETPEGPNIGLINSLATYARINKYGFIETPYRKVKEGVLTDEVSYLSALEEARYGIAQANVSLDKDNVLVDDLLPVRKGGDVALTPVSEIDYVDASSKQIVSVAASLIPFLEKDDANRALMGSNMQRQAVPLIKADSPLVGTGMETVVARDSGASVIARRDGIVDQVDASRIVIRVDDDGGSESSSSVDIYTLRKFQRSNQSTCINHRPVVRLGDRVKAGEIIADGPSTDRGELALGRNVLVAFMPWNGYNFEDSILISERLVREDVFTSIHIEEFEVMARDTKLGPEEITRDIANVGEEALRNLDEAGIIHVGAEVKAGDILVGKITPKGESPQTPEEKLLRAIFGEKAADVRDTSLRAPSGVGGTVVEVRIFNRYGIDKDERTQSVEGAYLERYAKDRDDEIAIVARNTDARLRELLLGQVVLSSNKLEEGSVVDNAALASMSNPELWNCVVECDATMKRIADLREHFDMRRKEVNDRFEDRCSKIERGDELPPGVMKVVKVFVAVKRSLQPGDKMAGRHGNKGVISKIMPIEDMPFLADGTPIDMVLNPLGVPSRMNAGQILETHFGWACFGIGKQINQLLEEWERASSGAGRVDWEDRADSTGDATDFVETAESAAEAVEIDSDARSKLIAILRQSYGDDYVSSLDEDQLKDLAKQSARGISIASPVFDGAKESDIVEMLERAGFSSTGQEVVYDGRSGMPLDRPVTVGIKYMLKLHHLVDDKIHARSIGPYSLVTQQPLGGKAQFGGQRLGEMEVWAMQGYGAAYNLKELLTVKSDDIAGRTKVYESMVRGMDSVEAGVPESFNVLVKEIRSLGLNIDLIDDSGEGEHIIEVSAKKVSDEELLSLEHSTGIQPTEEELAEALADPELGALMSGENY